MRWAAAGQADTGEKALGGNGPRGKKQLLRLS